MGKDAGFNLVRQGLVFLGDPEKLLLDRRIVAGGGKPAHVAGTVVVELRLRVFERH